MKYRNISDQTQTLIGHGIIEPGETVEVKGKLNNPNFKLDKKAKEKGK